MKVSQLNGRYFMFQLDHRELADREKTAVFLEDLKAAIPGERVKGQSLRFYLGEEKAFCIHRSQWMQFTDVVRRHYGKAPSYPFNQEELDFG